MTYIWQSQDDIELAELLTQEAKRQRLYELELWQQACAASSTRELPRKIHRTSFWPEVIILGVAMAVGMFLAWIRG